MSLKFSDGRMYLKSYDRLTEITDSNKIKAAYSLDCLSSPEETILLANLANRLLDIYKDRLATGASKSKAIGTFEFDEPSSIDYDEQN